MRRVNLSFIGQLQYFVVQRIVQHLAHLLGGEPFGPDKVRTADITDEDVAPMWVGTGANLTFRGTSPRIESQNGSGDPFSLGAPYIFKHFNVTANGTAGVKGTAKDNLNVPNIRFAEVLLIYAEAQNEAAGAIRTTKVRRAG